MSVYGLTELGDLDRPPEASSFYRVNDAQQCVQHVRTRLRLFTEEVFRDVRIGVQYFDLVMKPGISPVAIANHIASVALDTPGVVDCKMTYSVEPIRGVVTLDTDLTFLLEDQRTRVQKHENFQITLGGSIQT